MNTPEGRAVLGRGFDPTKLYDAGDIDTVNLFNGGLSLRIPIGPGYPQNGGTTFGLTLAYSSSLWDFKTFEPNLVDWCDENGCGQPPPDACISYTQKWPSWIFNAGLGWRVTLGELFAPGRIDLPQDDQELDGVLLNEGSTAQWRYDAPDGSSHEFSGDLHLVAGDGPLYSNDGSYLRLQCWQPPGGGGCSGPVLEMPDGARHYFEPDDDHPGADGRAYRVHRIEDAFRNSVTVGYAADGLTWTTTDQHGRQTRILFDDAAGIGVPGAFGDRFLKRVEMPAATATGGAARTLVYEFQYSGATGGRFCGENYPWGNTRHRPPLPPGQSYQMKVALLDSVTLPEFSTAAPGSHAEFHFDYVLETLFGPCSSQFLLAGADVPTGGRVEWDWSVYSMNPAQACPEGLGPRGGGDVEGCSDNRVFSASFSAGVAERRAFDGGALRGTWRYDQDLNLEPASDCSDRDLDTLYSTTRVVDPLGHQTVHYFSQFTNADHNFSPAPALGWTRADFGLPFSRHESVVLPGSTDEAFLSTETYQCDRPAVPPCDCAGEVCTASDPPAPGDACKLLQKTYVRYRHDADRIGNVGFACNQPDIAAFGGCRNLNPLVVATQTDHYDVSGPTPALAHSTRVAHASFDGLGHFRTTTHKADFCASLGSQRGDFCRGDHRESFTAYNPERGDLDAEPAHPGTFTVPTEDARWLWTRYTEQRVRDFGPNASLEVEEKATFDFDPDNGFLLSKRTRAANVACGAGACPAGHDLLVELTSEKDGTRSTGNVASERYSGGGRVPVDQGPQYEVSHTYEAGVLASSQAICPAGQGPCERSLRLALHEIDDATGLMLKSTDAAGLSTSYEYDAASRLAKMTPQGESPSEIEYKVAVGTSPASVAVTRGSGVSQTRRTVVFDGFGRVAKDLSSRADGGQSEVQRTYWAGGSLRGETTVGPAGAPDGETTYECYDPLGRVLEQRYPDHVAETDPRKTIFHWFGPRFLRTETLGVARDGGAVAKEERVEFRDSLGRAFMVEERSAGGPSGFRQTLYKHDLQDRLVRVGMSDGENFTCTGPSTCQYRDFLYDGLGFLRAERHPELSGSVPFVGQFPWNVVHDRYDARGNPGRRRDGRTDLTYDYDFAGRLVTVAEPTQPLPSPLQEFFYADRNRDADGNWSANGVDKTAGKLFQARQHQEGPLSSGPVTVTETFGYRGAGGRLSDYSVRSSSGQAFAGVPTLRFTTRLAYDGLGQLSRVTYPHCSGEDSELCPAGDPARVVENVYAHGWLTGVQKPGDPPGQPSWASISYHPSGLPHAIVHGSGAKTVQERDPLGLLRPAGIRTEGLLGGGDWNSGPIAYDVLGNIFRVGAEGGAETDRFLYDHVNRVVEARLGSPPGLQQEQRYTYDVFGNLRSITTQPGDGVETTLTLAVDAATNRIGAAGQALYDDSGNVIQAAFLNLANAYWDPLSRLRSVLGTGLNRGFLYTAFGERLASFDNLACNGACTEETWTPRGPGNKVLREYTRSVPSEGPATWESKDYVYRGGSLLASVAGSEVRHFHLDHLGSPRVISDQAKNRKAFHVYFPFGREATDRNQDDERMKFTGHERDVQTEGQIAGDSEADDLDYMHARYYSPWAGRFLSVDETLGDPRSPGTFNRYAYARNNPVAAVDPDGRSGVYFSLSVFSVQRPNVNAVGPAGEFTLSVAIDHTGGVAFLAGVREGIGIGAAAGGEIGLFSQEDVSDLNGTSLGGSVALPGFSASIDNPVLTIDENGDHKMVSEVDLSASGGNLGVGAGVIYGPQETFVWKGGDFGEMMDKLETFLSTPHLECIFKGCLSEVGE